MAVHIHRFFVTTLIHCDAQNTSIPTSACGMAYLDQQITTSNITIYFCRTVNYHSVDESNNGRQNVSQTSNNGNMIRIRMNK